MYMKKGFMSLFFILHIDECQDLYLRSRRYFREIKAKTPLHMGLLGCLERHDLRPAKSEFPIFRAYKSELWWAVGHRRREKKKAKY